MMKRTSVLVHSFLVLSLGLLAAPSLGAGQHSCDQRAAELTEEAIAAGAAGDHARRQDLLWEAMRIAPDYGPAHWEAGQIEVDGDWLLVEQAQEAAAADPDVAEYERLKSVSPDAPLAHLQLARWCRRNQLTDEARYHWLAVVAADPQNSEALSELGAAWSGGQLLPREEAEAAEREANRLRRNARQWRTKISHWLRDLRDVKADREKLLSEVRAVSDFSAIPAFEQFAADAPADQDQADPNRRAISLAFVDALEELHSYEASASLVRHSVLAPDKQVRGAATTALATRPAHEYMPLLIGELRAPIEVSYTVDHRPLTGSRYELELFTRDANTDYSKQFAATSRVGLKDQPLFTPGEVARNGLRMQHAVSSATEVSLAARSTAARTKAIPGIAAQVAASVAETNANAFALNQRIAEVLEELTGKEFGPYPDPWWDYWRDYNEYSDPSYRPQYTSRQYYDYSYDAPAPYLAPPPPPTPSPGSHSCFAAGTPVWTKTGKVRIEELRPADLVLTEDVATGELAYQPVLATTKREPSPMRKIVINDESLLTTLGHPFWVVGKGWRMAKELSLGDTVLTVHGPAAIDQLADAAEAEAFNLVVAGHPNYFVGADGVLVHDNSPRRPNQVRLGME